MGSGFLDRGVVCASRLAAVAVSLTASAVMPAPAFSQSASGTAAASSLPASPVGLWKTIDEETKQAKSLVRVLEKDGVLVGRVEKILIDAPEAKCGRCTDERKDQPIQGMTIITDMRRDGEYWDHGRILDPQNGKVYSSRMKLLEGGRKLEVRGYVGTPMLGRSQTWVRAE